MLFLPDALLADILALSVARVTRWVAPYLGGAVAVVLLPYAAVELAYARQPRAEARVSREAAGEPPPFTLPVCALPLARPLTHLTLPFFAAHHVYPSVLVGAVIGLLAGTAFVRGRAFARRVRPSFAALHISSPAASSPARVPTFADPRFDSRSVSWLRRRTCSSSGCAIVERRRATPSSSRPPRSEGGFGRKTHASCFCERRGAEPRRVVLIR